MLQLKQRDNPRGPHFAAVHDALLRRSADLKKRKQLLVEASVYKRSLDQHTYQDEFDRLNEEITLTDIEAEDARLDQLDVEAAVEFAQYVLLNAARIWAESSPRAKATFSETNLPGWSALCRRRLSNQHN